MPKADDPGSGIDPVNSPIYTYLQVADKIAMRIEVGDYTHKLPAERALAAELGVAYQTVRRSMGVLRERGLIITRQGRGTFVADAVRKDGLRAKPEPAREGETD
jgi:DNA-binding GntR family transcriptional regulator